jgi:hypothetical protein
VDRLTRGQVWEYISGSRQYRVVVVSSDEFSGDADLRPWGLVILRTAPDSLVVALARDDPLAGAYVHVPVVLRLDPTGLRTNLGYLSHSTMIAVELALREFLELP